ncbi:MAG: CCA tRNA nucleotidyltransferase [Phycisphaerales bacterium]
MTHQGHSLRDTAVGIIRRLRVAGHVAYLAGGCVRDAQLGVEPKDYDVATDARPEAVRKLFRRSRYVGEAFGVVLVYAGVQSAPGVEVATFRTEWGYEDGRRPGGVEFTDAEHDARRRDFTVNGLFADPLDEKLEPVPAGEDRVIDFVGGVKDLEARVLRAIGDPGERFREDYLRMLRAARFAARLGFEIEPGTAEAIRASADNLNKISRERIGQEVMLMLTGRDPVRAAELMQGLKIDGAALGEGHVDAPLRALRGLPPGSGYALCLAAWMLDRAGANCSVDDAAAFVEKDAKSKLRGWRKALCLSNGDRDALGDILGLLPRVVDWDGLGIARRKRLLAEPGWRQAWELVRAFGPGGYVTRVETDAEPLWAQGVAPDRFVTGDDLIRMGVAAGPRIGDLLEGVYDEQLEGRVRNKDEGLAWVRDHQGRVR